MSAVCRVCLSGNTTTTPRSLINNLLIDVYEILVNTRFNCEDARPRVMCQLCYRKLLSCRAFSQMAHRSEKIFDQIYDKGLEANHKCITDIILEMNEQLSETTQQFNTIDDDATDADLQLTIKDEPIPNIDIKEEVTTEQDKAEEERRMSAVCRVCLAGNMTLHSLVNNLLIDVYEILSNNKFNCEDARPRVMCQLCYRKLLNCRAFSQMAHRTEKIFDQIYEKGLEATHECITEMNLKMNEQLSETTQQFDTIDDDATDADLQLTIKDEPIANINIKEEVTTEQDKVVELGFVTEMNLKMNEQLSETTQQFDTIDGDASDADLQLTIKDEPIANIDIREVTIEQSKMVELGSVAVDYPEIQLELQENDSDNHAEQTKQDDSKMTLFCNDCNEIFFHKSKLISHIRNSHSQFKGKRKDLLVEHTRTNNGEKPFVCIVCDKQFKHNSLLVAHTRMHTGERPFACNVCDKQFKQSSHLFTHFRTHTRGKRFACIECDKRFHRKEYLVTHMSIHTGEKPFACRVCDKQFRLNCHLITHMRMHTGEKPFVCNVCDKRFINSSNLRRHVRIHKY